MLVGAEKLTDPQSQQHRLHAGGCRGQRPSHARHRALAIRVGNTDIQLYWIAQNSSQKICAPRRVTTLVVRQDRRTQPSNPNIVDCGGVWVLHASRHGLTGPGGKARPASSGGRWAGSGLAHQARLAVERRAGAPRGPPAARTGMHARPATP